MLLRAHSAHSKCDDSVGYLLQQNWMTIRCLFLPFGLQVIQSCFSGVECSCLERVFEIGYEDLLVSGLGYDVTLGLGARINAVDGFRKVGRP